MISKDGLALGETLLFSYRGRLRFVAKAASGRLEGTATPHEDYPCCFLVDLGSLRPADVKLPEVEEQLRAEAGLRTSLRGRGWTRIPDSNRAEQVINGLTV
jgi:hypothetical protein